jgi:hypothetical protein
MNLKDLARIGAHARIKEMQDEIKRLQKAFPMPNEQARANRIAGLRRYWRNKRKENSK